MEAGRLFQEICGIFGGKGFLVWNERCPILRRPFDKRDYRNRFYLPLVRRSIDVVLEEGAASRH
ncbi:hypothetical protein DPMN_109926 [Dreissena polymorpha]|uniref:Uncharacterized protein n=1 Tax=Dreissena polymorpha TaxID=45954 RepID=A0A9D4KBV9_DREPO|nr:hypothetical protein DPMN_109926 [Dreissena polymorpha]